MMVAFSLLNGICMYRGKDLMNLHVCSIREFSKLKAFCLAIILRTYIKLLLF